MLQDPGQLLAFVWSGWTATWPTQLLAIIWILWIISWVVASFWSGRTKNRGEHSFEVGYKGYKTAQGSVASWLCRVEKHSAHRCLSRSIYPDVNSFTNSRRRIAGVDR